MPRAGAASIRRREPVIACELPLDNGEREGVQDGRRVRTGRPTSRHHAPHQHGPKLPKLSARRA